MLLRVGELAKRTGLTVRTLHHYDEIGLLVPSMRSDAGYRLYRCQDVARLHHIQALRSLGMSLADIGTLLDRSSPSLAVVIERQIQLLERKIADQTQLRDRLVALHRQFENGDEPEMDDWLKTLEMMTMYDRYFTPQELDRLPLYQADDARQAEWRALIGEAEELIRRDVPAADTAAQELAQRWMATLERDTAGDPTLLDKLNAMYANEPEAQAQLGISKRVSEYVIQALAEHKLAIYRRYLSPDEFAHMRRHYPQRMQEWPSLMARLRQQLERNASPEDPAVQALAQQWLDMLHSFAGNDPATHGKIQQANEQEPELQASVWMTEPMKEFLGKAIAHLTER
ncbi:MAG: MerR family transcriptional regulator [Halomonas sp.]|jgi:DNA-binding transcriptional MerR regulator|uniref:MerR family transcriptional regulator n=1 Tax=Billgrantia tianxiuensis TaxID=2497861 RepID=A0A6I6SGW5_9GAMM|nr:MULTISPECIES: MerR family transcriptional regulator [Halomonas]MCE8035783.1 MerR family transcriptional regulator [Halomonas sp. MCCC 1A11057]MDX5433967.1 MerR family transcriptional regulator [Halomonas sp.]QHC48641.1 MerR family transcriptional regulator [Halomonas tianxiuensis]